MEKNTNHSKTFQFLHAELVFPNEEQKIKIKKPKPPAQTLISKKGTEKPSSSMPK